MNKKYKIITTIDEAIDWLISNYKEFITKNQQELNIRNTLANALYYYTGSMSQEYNNILSKVDQSTEKFLDELEQKLNYKKWYCGHYHIEKSIDKIRFMFNDIDLLD